MMTRWIITLILFFLNLAAWSQEITRLGDFSLPKGAGEIVTVDGSRQLLVTTQHNRWSRGLVFVSLKDLENPKILGKLSLKNMIRGGIDGVSSVAIDPTGRGFAAAAIIPKNSIAQRGLVVLVDLDTRKVIAKAQTGYHPDCVAFSPDGKYLTVACEGEWKEGKKNTPGSLSFFEFAPGKKFHMVDIPLKRANGLRLLNGSTNDLEPEYITIQGSRAYVTLQENNGLGIFDLRRKRWQSLRSFGSWNVTMDPSDRDGPRGGRQIAPIRRVHAMPMPDTISSFRWKGRTYLATANEGADAGAVRAKKLGKNQHPKLDKAYLQRLTRSFGKNPLSDALLGRLEISPIDGDLDGDGDIDRLTSLGTRSFSIWDAASGKRVYDSGTFFARVGTANPTMFNVNGGKRTKWDTRSDNQGTEPEAIYTRLINGRPILVVATERQNGVFFFDCRNPSKPRPFAAFNEMTLGHFAPESALLLPASKSPTGKPLCIVGWEGSSSLTFYQLNF